MKKKGSVKFSLDKPSLFYPTLKKRVDEYFKKNNIRQHGNSAMILKSVILLAAYIGPLLVLIILQPPVLISLLLWILMGISMAGIGMSVMHDALHGAYSGKKAVNYMMGTMLNLLGGSMFNWKLQHNILHHTYTNVHKMDDDIDEKVMLRFTEHDEKKNVHRHQWWYAFLFYGITTLYWVTAKDFIQYVKYRRNGVNNQPESKNRIVLLKLVFLKLLYFFVFLALPLILGVAASKVIPGFIAMHVLAGVILTVTFQLAHTVEGTTHPLPDHNGVIRQDWAIHQMETTVNFSPRNKILSWYVGGLNFQVEHHLFPRISHVHYPAIAPIVKSTAKEFGVPYNENPTLGKAIRSHVQLLKKLGRLPDLDEIMG